MCIIYPPQSYFSSDVGWKTGEAVRPPDTISGRVAGQ